MTQRDDLSYGLISAYVDGELTPDECARVEQLVASCDKYRQALADYRAIRGGIGLLPPCRLDSTFADRVIAAANALGTALVPSTEQPAQPAPVRGAVGGAWHWPTAVGLLVTLAGVVVLALSIWGPELGTTISGGSALVSQTTPHPPTAVEGRTDGSTAGSPNRPTPEVESVPAVAAPLVRPEPTPVPQVAQSGSAADAQGLVGEDRALAHTLPAPPAQQRETASAPTAGGGPESIGVAERAGRIAHEPDRLGHTPMPDDDHASGRAPVDRPFSGPQQLLLVMDVALTRQGLEKDAFSRVLAAQGVSIQDAVPIDAQLEEVMLASRFFDPVPTPADGMAAMDIGLSLVFMRAHAGQIDGLWRAMRAVPGDISRVTLDMAIMPADRALFQDLRRVADLRAAGAAAAAGEPKSQTQPASACRLVLDPHWRGTIPAWMLDTEARETLPVEGIPGQPTPTVPLPPGGRLGENIDADVLFVIHLGRVPSGP